MTIFKTPYEGGTCFVTVANDKGEKFAGQDFSSNNNANCAIRIVQYKLKELGFPEAKVVTNPLKHDPEVDQDSL